MGLLGWIRSKLFGKSEGKRKGEEKECIIPRGPAGIAIMGRIKEWQYHRDWIERFLVEPLKTLGFDIPKPGRVECRIILGGSLWRCLSEKKNQAFKALKEFRFREAAELTGEVLAILDMIWQEIENDICR